MKTSLDAFVEVRNEWARSPLGQWHSVACRRGEYSDLRGATVRTRCGATFQAKQVHHGPDAPAPVSVCCPACPLRSWTRSGRSARVPGSSERCRGVVRHM